MAAGILSVLDFLKEVLYFVQILLSFEAFGEAFKLLDQACSEGIQPDLLLYNAFLRAADEKVINSRNKAVYT